MSRDSDRKKLRREEEDEEREIHEYYLRLQYMCENCPEGDRNMRKLIEEQEEMLLILKRRKGEFFEESGKSAI